MRKLLVLFLTLITNQDGHFSMFNDLFCPDDDGTGAGGGSSSDGKSKDDGKEKDNQKKQADGGGTAKGDKIDDLPSWAQDEIKKLRNENASRRKSNSELSDRLGKLEKGLKSAFGVDGDEEVDLSEQVSALSNELTATQFNSAVVEMAYENEIPKDKIGFFKYRLNEALGLLGDDEELPKEILDSIVQEVKGVGKGAAQTSVNGDKKPNEDGKKSFEKLTAEEFVKMSEGDKNIMFTTDRARYDALHLEAKQKRLYKFRF